MKKNIFKFFIIVLTCQHWSATPAPAGSPIDEVQSLSALIDGVNEKTISFDQTDLKEELSSSQLNTFISNPSYITQEIIPQLMLTSGPNKRANKAELSMLLQINDQNYKNVTIVVDGVLYSVAQQPRVETIAQDGRKITKKIIIPLKKRSESDSDLSIIVRAQYEKPLITTVGSIPGVKMTPRLQRIEYWTSKENPKEWVAHEKINVPYGYGMNSGFYIVESIEIQESLNRIDQTEKIVTRYHLSPIQINKKPFLFYVEQSWNADGTISDSAEGFAQDDFSINFWQKFVSYLSWSKNPGMR